MSPVQTAHAPLFTLRITDTRNGRSQSTGVRHALTLIGTREGCWIRPRSSRLSPVHCAIVHTGDVIVVRDLVSDSGTLVNESPVDLHVIRETDRVTIGHWDFVADAQGNSPAAPDRDHAIRWIALIDADGETVFESDAPAVLIGSNVRCDIVLNDRQASAAHALIVRVDGRWAIADLLTSHGTRVNEQPIDQVRRLDPDDTIQIGSSAYSVALRAEPSAITSPPAAREDRQTMEREAEQLAHDRDALAKRHEELDARSETDREALANQQRELDARSAALASKEQETQRKCESLRVVQQRLQEERDAQLAESQTIRTEREALEAREARHSERERTIDTLTEKMQLDHANVDQDTARVGRERDDLAKLQQELEARSSDVAVAREQLKRQFESLSAERLQLDQQRETQETLRTNVQSEHKALGRWEEELRQKERMLTAAAEKLRAEFIALRQRARTHDGRATEGQPPEAGGNRHGNEGSSPRAALVDRDWLEFFSG